MNTYERSNKYTCRNTKAKCCTNSFYVSNPNPLSTCINPNAISTRHKPTHNKLNNHHHHGC